jgi:hypothetical protein
MPPCRRFDTGLGHDRKIALPFDVCSLAVGRAAAQAKALELFAAVGAVDMEAISALLHRLAVSPSVDDLFADRLIAGVVPILTTHAAKAAVQVPTSSSIDERVAADEAGNDVVLRSGAIAISEDCGCESFGLAHSYLTAPTSASRVSAEEFEPKFSATHPSHHQTPQ